MLFMLSQSINIDGIIKDIWRALHSNYIIVFCIIISLFLFVFGFFLFCFSSHPFDASKSKTPKSKVLSFDLNLLKFIVIKVQQIYHFSPLSLLWQGTRREMAVLGYLYTIYEEDILREKKALVVSFIPPGLLGIPPGLIWLFLVSYFSPFFSSFFCFLNRKLL